MTKSPWRFGHGDLTILRTTWLVRLLYIGAFFHRILLMSFYYACESLCPESVTPDFPGWTTTVSFSLNNEGFSEESDSFISSDGFGVGFLATFGLSASLLSSVSVFVSVCCVSGFRSAVVPVAASDSGIYEPTNQFKKFWYFPTWWAAKTQASLCKCAVLPEPLQLAHKEGI